MKKNRKKKMFKRILIPILSILMLMTIGCNKKDKEDNKPEPDREETPKTVQLLSFDSYEEVTGTEIRLENSFGKLEINKDKKFITEGKGSLMICPQGDYARQDNWNPYMQFDCDGTTIATNDFSNFRRVTFDAYNNTDKELHFSLKMKAQNANGSNINVGEVTYTLKPNAWTECVYDLEDMVGTAFKLSNVQYMTFTFLEHKTSKNDVPNEIYFDNLRGICYETPVEYEEANVDFYEGIDFENKAQAYLVEGGTNNNLLELSWATYADDGIERTEEFGEHGIKSAIPGTIWPGFSVSYGKEIPKDTILSFWVYVDVDMEECPSFTFASHAGKNTNGKANSVLTDVKINEWFEVSVALKSGADSTFVYMNLDDDWSNPQNKCVFGDNAVVYIDNMKLTAPKEYDFYEGVDFEEKSSIYLFEGGINLNKFAISWGDYARDGIKVSKEYGAHALKADISNTIWPGFAVNFGKSIPKGTILSFWVYIDVDMAKCPDFIFASHAGKTTKGAVNSVVASDLDINKWFEVKIRMNDTSDSAYVYLNLDDDWNDPNHKSVLGDNVSIYIDNMKLGNGTLAPSNGIYKGKAKCADYENPTKEVKDYNAVIPMDIPANSKVTYTITANKKVSCFSWVFDNIVRKELFAKAWIRMDTKWTNSVIVKNATSELWIKVRPISRDAAKSYEYAVGDEIEFTISDIKVEPAGEAGEQTTYEGTALCADYNDPVTEVGDYNAVIPKDIPANSKVTYTITANKKVSCFSWFYDNKAHKQLFSKAWIKMDTKWTNSVIVKDATTELWIKVRPINRDAAKSYEYAVGDEIEFTISDIKVEPAGEMGEKTTYEGVALCADYSDPLTEVGDYNAVIPKDIPANSKVTYTITANKKVSCFSWFYDNKAHKELFSKAWIPMDTTWTNTVTVKDATTELWIKVRPINRDGAKSYEYAVGDEIEFTISDIKVEPNDEPEEEEKPLEEREFTQTISHTAGQNTDWNFTLDIPEYAAGSVVSYDVVSTAGVKTATFYFQRYMKDGTQAYANERYAKIFTNGELSTGEITTTKAINSLYIKVRIWGSDSNIPTGDYPVTIKNIKIMPLEKREFTKTISHTAGKNTDWNFVMDIPEYAAGAKVSYDVVSTAGIKTATFYYQRYMNGTTQAYANEKYAKIFTGGELSTGEITTDKAINSLYIKVRIWGSDSNIPTGNYPVTIKNIKIQGVENGL